MAQETLHPIPTIARLASELLLDLKTLVEQQVQLLRHEVEAELYKVKTAAIWLVVGGALLGLGGLMFIIMLVHLIAALTGLPLWASYGIVSALLLAGGVVLLLSARKVGGSVHVLPIRTLRTMKEDALWIKERIVSSKT